MKFVDTFKRLYEAGDLRLFQNEHLKFNISNDLESEKSLKLFVDEISKINLNRNQDIIDDDQSNS